MEVVQQNPGKKKKAEDGLSRGSNGSGKKEKLRKLKLYKAGLL